MVPPYQLSMERYIKGEDKQRNSNCSPVLSVDKMCACVQQNCIRFIFQVPSYIFRRPFQEKCEMGGRRLVPSATLVRQFIYIYETDWEHYALM